MWHVRDAFNYCLIDNMKNDNHSIKNYTRHLSTNIMLLCNNKNMKYVAFNSYLMFVFMFEDFLCSWAGIYIVDVVANLMMILYFIENIFNYYSYITIVY
jgi:hypothetical protein